MRKSRLDLNNQKISIIKKIEAVLLSVLIVSFFILIYCIYVSINMESEGAYNSNYNVEKLETENEIKNIENKKTIEEVIENVNEAVVGISKLKSKGSTIFLEDSSETLGLGTGFIVSEDGYIITNEHVSNNNLSNCYITLANGATYKGEVVWSDEDIDLSVLKINANELKYLELGDSDNIKIAQKVYAIGNPIGFEFQRTVTSGIISNLNRTVKITENDEDKYMEDLIQTDASINAGNSGGPLIDEEGKVIGVNSIKISTAEGIGFAIPINVIKPIIDNLKENKNYKTVNLGIFGYDKNVIPYIKQELGISQNLEDGIYVVKIVKNSIADLYGIKEGDIIEKIDEIKIKKMSDLRKYIYSKKIGEKIKINLIRNNKKEEIEIILK